jgi:hypothetical protein
MLAEDLDSGTGGLQERRVDRAIRQRDVAIHRRDQPNDRRRAELVAIAAQRLERAIAHERRRQRRLAMVDVTDGADVDVRFSALELFFQHDGSLQEIRLRRPRPSRPVEYRNRKRKSPLRQDRRGLSGVLAARLFAAQTLGTILPSRRGQAF